MVFASLYAEKMDSLEAFLQSHKHIHKVQASDLLTNRLVWERIIFYASQKVVKTPYQETILEQYDTIKKEIGFSPFYLVEKYSAGFKKHKEPDAIKVVYILSRLHHFFDILQREHYKRRIRKALSEEMEYIEFIMDRNGEMKRQFQKMKADLQKLGINFDNILKGEDGEKED